MTNNLEIKAKEFAYNAHKGQTRKGKDVPFTNHLDSVVSIAKELTNDEHILAAAWLHDTVEDTDTTIDEIYEQFGPIVGKYVELESEDKRPSMSAEDSWLVRKQEQLDELSNIPESLKNVYIIALSDKLANLREMKEEYAELGDDLWNKFNNTDPKAHKWYYQSFADIINDNKSLSNSKELIELNQIIFYLFQ